MVKGTLTVAMDFAKRKDVKHEVFSWRIGEQWYVGKIGPTYANTIKVTEYDEDGLKKLQEIEDKEWSKS